MQLLESPLNFEGAEPNYVLINKGRMYTYKIIQFNYTIYDMWQDQAVVNPSTPHCNIMLLAPTRTS